MAEHKCDKLEMVLYLQAQCSSSRCQPARLQVLCLTTCSSPEPWSEGAVRDARRGGCRGAECVFTVPMRNGVFPWKPALWLLFKATWQTKTSVFTMGPVIPKSRAWVVDSSFEWTNEFYELLQVILKHLLEFKNVPSCFSIHNQSVLLCCLGEGLYEDLYYLTLKFFSHSLPEIIRRGVGRRQDG